ncbi:MAG TPA: NAD(P)H-dependent glycerol-3-phosphate dehydrogenase [Candidatus Methylomirabilis sp.]|jgi:glycerol-3-phosphate dehydrogenase (NAD(P)+)|nr:NAD(P)H-dependent glycerol-3-phosphate dehydrogenase [Candidatus Methylomirabilis sp.]
MIEGDAAVLGAGAWGTALACLLSSRDHPTVLWARRAEVAKALREDRENRVYLPAVPLPPALRVTTDITEAVGGAGLVLFAVPAQHLRAIAAQVAPALGGAPLTVSAAKGLEVATGSRMTEVLAASLPASCAGRLAALSGPTFAAEVGRGLPAAAVVAAVDAAVGTSVQRALSGSTFRLYATTDVLGVELAGAVKNVVAIAAGVADGLALGASARASLITRGLAEMSRLGRALSARPETFAGLAGVGDLILTCSSDLSRNRTVGLELGRGRDLPQILAGRRTVAEGVETARAVKAVAARLGVDTPICTQVHAILFEGRPPREALNLLMARELKVEAD